MDRLRIQGGKKLSGKIQLSGSKNASLPILFASLLTDTESTIENVPNLSDIKTTIKLLSNVGAKVRWNPKKQCVKISAKKITSAEATYDLVRTMRASILILAPLLARKGSARVSLPGGCAIGARPVDLHLTALEALGARFHLEAGYVNGFLPEESFIGGKIDFPFPSVGATETALMAASVAKGKTIITNAAREPEIVDLANYLKKQGAKISGAGKSRITVIGYNPTKNTKTAVKTAKKAKKINHAIIPDRIEAATFWIAGLITGGKVSLKIQKGDVQSVLDVLKKSGAKITNKSGWINVESGKEIKPVHVVTQPFPGFPTDAQAQFAALMTQAKGVSKITETIFENRFMHIPELSRMGGEFVIQGNQVLVDGPCALQGATVMATDLRASASLIIAALAAHGETIVRRIYHLDRGYEQIEKKLRRLGAEIIREKDV